MLINGGNLVSTILLFSLFGALEILIVFSPVQGVFNHTKCPAPWELQSDTVKTSLSRNLKEGCYELALHDYTQFPICPAPKCIRSHKIMNYQTNQINDTFTLDCFGSDYSITFLFNLTNTTFLEELSTFLMCTSTKVPVVCTSGP